MNGNKRKSYIENECGFSLNFPSQGHDLMIMDAKFMPINDGARLAQSFNTWTYTQSWAYSNYFEEFLY